MFHRDEEACNGAIYLRINDDGLMEEFYQWTVPIWLKIRTEIYNGETVQIISTGSLWPGKESGMIDWCECFYDLDPTNSVEKI